MTVFENTLSDDVANLVPLLLSAIALKAVSTKIKIADNIVQHISGLFNPIADLLPCAAIKFDFLI